MEKVCDSILDTIGGTPLVRINRMNPNPGCRVLAKLEYFNPLSCIKERIASAMIEAGERTGKIRKDTVIIEPTSGNTGIGLALVCAVKGYRLILTMPDTMSIERRSLLKYLGAEIVLTPGDRGMQGAVDRAAALAKQVKNSYIPQQFENPANPEVHRRTTAVEIWNATGGQVDFFVAGVGTGGTLTGVGEMLKNNNPWVKIIAVEPDASPVLSGGAPGKHGIQGIGAGFIPAVLNRDILDEIIRVKDPDAGKTSRRLAREEGILCGISGGAAMWAALEVARRPDTEGKTVVTVIPDTGERYLSTWLFEE
ncbi:cysteine synthase A [bacterium]|nr:cysteine synthase A [bacterium]